MKSTTTPPETVSPPPRRAGMLTLAGFLSVACLFMAAVGPEPTQAQGNRNDSKIKKGQMAAAAAEKARKGGIVQRGKYLVTVMGCQDCHSPHDQMGRLVPGRELSGHPENAPLPQWDPSLFQRHIAAGISPTLTAFAGPFGVSVAGNLTPDKETGIGTLTAEGLIESWRTGHHWRKKDGKSRPVLPPMPMAPYKHLTDGDIRAIHAYLMTLKPIRNNVPDSVPAPPPPGTGAGG